MDYEKAFKLAGEGFCMHWDRWE